MRSTAGRPPGPWPTPPPPAERATQAWTPSHPHGNGDDPGCYSPDPRPPPTNRNSRTQRCGTKVRIKTKPGTRMRTSKRQHKRARSHGDPAHDVNRRHLAMSKPTEHRIPPRGCAPTRSLSLAGLLGLADQARRLLLNRRGEPHVTHAAHIHSGGESGLACPTQRSTSMAASVGRPVVSGKCRVGGQ